MNKIDILSLNLEELKIEFTNLGEKPFRAGQVYSWLHQKLVSDFDDMTNISKNLRNTLDEKFYITPIEIAKKLTSQEDGTVKYLFKLHDNSLIEAVLMRYSHGNSVCISTQAGCRMGCKFCASTLNGLERNLNPSELIGQIYKIQNDVGERVDNIVLMGTGEPLDNFDNVVKFFSLINSKDGLNIGLRHITLSTCGILPRIYDLADLGLQVNLALSLNAPNDEIRRTTMPIANKYSIEELLKACKYYSDNTGRRITYEYSVINGVNDLEDHAHELGNLLRGSLCHVNLIPVNAVEERGLTPPKHDNIVKLSKILMKYGVQTTIRRTLGSDINAACGQLRLGNIE